MHRFYFERALADKALASVNAPSLAAKGLSNWSSDTLAWMVRAGARSATAGDATRWALVEQAVDAMSPEQLTDAAWTYWKARALLARAGQGASDPTRQKARELMARIASPMHFYGQLAAEELHGTPVKGAAAASRAQ